MIMYLLQSLHPSLRLGRVKSQFLYPFFTHPLFQSIVTWHFVPSSLMLLCRMKPPVSLMHGRLVGGGRGRATLLSFSES